MSKKPKKDKAGQGPSSRPTPRGPQQQSIKRECGEESFSATTFFQSSTRALAAAIGTANALPGPASGSGAGGDWDYYASFSAFRKVMSAERTQLADAMETILRWQGIKGLRLPQAGLPAASATSAAADLAEMLAEANDQVLERANNAIDEAAGLRRPQAPDGNDEPELMEVSEAAAKDPPAPPSSGSWNERRNPAVRPRLEDDQEQLKLVTSKNVLRPQLQFKDLIDNSASNPFSPRLEEKPNQIKPLSVLPEYGGDDGSTIVG